MQTQSPFLNSRVREGIWESVASAQMTASASTERVKYSLQLVDATRYFNTIRPLPALLIVNAAGRHYGKIFLATEVALDANSSNFASRSKSQISSNSSELPGGKMPSVRAHSTRIKLMRRSNVVSQCSGTDTEGYQPKDEEDLHQVQDSLRTVPVHPCR